MIYRRCWRICVAEQALDAHIAGDRPPNARRVALVTLGCARNEVDSEELAERLHGAGWEISDQVAGAEVVLVNTCGFIEQAKRDSIDTLLDVADDGARVVAVGCMAERYGAELAAALPEATVLGFDDYEDIDARLVDILAGRTLVPHTPRDRRTRLPIAPVARAAAAPVPTPGFAPLGTRLLARGASVPVKLAAGCDRRCSFCAIPSFRGSFVSRPPEAILAEVRGLPAQGVREVVLVSENSTSYGKDLGDLRLLEKLLPRLGEVPGIEWVRVSYLQPAEMRPDLVSTIASTPGVAAYFDLSFQHASPQVLRKMRRFGGTTEFLDLIQLIRQAAPHAGLRSNVIVGFPGERDEDIDELCGFLEAAELDAVGVFGYSDEEGTEAVGLPDHLDEVEVRARVEQVSSLVDELMVQRAQDRVGDTGRVLVSAVAEGGAEGRAEHQGPEDAATFVRSDIALAVGDVVDVEFIAADGVDLIARLRS